MPLVRSDGLPTQHMRALAYWSAAPELDDFTSLQVCGTEWVSHVTCRRQLLDVLATAPSNGHPNPVTNGNGRGGPPTHDVFHGMVARSNEAVSSSKEGALLIDDLVEWAEERLARRPGAGRGARAPPAARADGGADRARLLPPADDLEAGRVRARAPLRAGAQPRLGHRLRPGAGAGRRRATADDPDYRFAVVQSELFRRHLRSAVADLDPVPLARYLSHFARWYAADGALAAGRRGRPGGARRGRPRPRAGGGLMRTLLVDNHDSYTYNVFHLLAAASGEEPVVVNNDAVSWRVLSRSKFDAFVLSPGSGTPGTLARLRRLPGHPPLQRGAGAGDLPRPPGDRQPARGRGRRARRSRCTAGSATSATAAPGSSPASRRTSPSSATTRWRSPARSAPKATSSPGPTTAS